MTMLSAENLSLAGVTTNMGPGPQGAGVSAVWSGNQNSAFNSLRLQGYAAFLTDAQKCRLERLRQARLLFNGEHRKYYLDEARTSFNFPFVKNNGVTSKMYLTYNVLGLISLKGADLLFGQAPLLDCDDEAQWDALQALARRTQLHAVLMDAAIAASAEGEIYLEGVIHTDGQVYIRQIPNETIFPAGELGPDGQYGSYVRYLCRNAGTAETPIWLLLETTIAPGLISRACCQLDKAMKKIKQLDLAVWDPALSAADAQTATGITQNTIVWVPNQAGIARSDYDCALELQDAVNAKNTQISRVLQKHSDPKLAVPRKMADPQGNIPALAELFYTDSPEDIPQYITWNAELANALADRGFALNQLLVRTETSPVLLGLKEGAAPDAYKKVRLESFNSLTKAARKSIVWTSAVQQILNVAMAMENTLPGIGYATDPVGVTLRDGIPADEGEQATTIATLRAAGAMSRRRAVRMQLGDEEATDSELAELDREAANATPSVLFGEPTGERTNDPQITQTDTDSNIADKSAQSVKSVDGGGK